MQVKVETSLLKEWLLLIAAATNDQKRKAALAILRSDIKALKEVKSTEIRS